MKIYTKTGDRGDTGLFGGARVSKSSPRVASYGDVDELNSVIGVAVAHWAAAEAERGGAGDGAGDGALALAPLLTGIQCELFNLGAELASTPTKSVNLGVPLISDAEIEALERAIDHYEAQLPPLKTFILPGGAVAAAQLHMARTVCRRAERSLVALGAQEPMREALIRYLNRLSDLLFVLARVANRRARVADVPWQGREPHRSA